MSAAVIAAILCGLAILVGCLGIIVPVLPGSILILIAGLAWAIVAGGPAGWIAFAVIAVFSAAGMTASWVLTGRRLKERAVPNSSILWSAVGAVIGFFVIPVLGLAVGFLAGLYAAEYSRLRDARRAWESSVAAIKALGIGILVEFILAVGSALTFAVSVATHFLQAA